MSQRRASLAGLGGGIRRPGGSQGDPPVEVQKDGSVGGKGTASDAEAAKAARRRQSLSMMSAGSMGGGMNTAMKDHICKQSGITDDTPPQEKMDIVLKLAKEKGKTAEQIFKYFDKDGDARITPDEFKRGIEELDPMRFKMSDEEMDGLVKKFDKDQDGTVDMSEFRTYCYNLPGLAWKKERLKQKLDAKKDSPRAPESPTAAAPVPAPHVSVAVAAQ